MIVRKGISVEAAPHGDFEHPYRHRVASKIAKKGPKKRPKKLKEREKMKKRQASNGQRYPLLCSIHLGT